MSGRKTKRKPRRAKVVVEDDPELVYNELGGTNPDRSALNRVLLTTKDDFVERGRWKFKTLRTDDEKDVWSCNMQSIQCMHHLGSGDRCKRLTTYTMGYCWQHLKSVLNIRIGPTTLQDDKGETMQFGGLFACDPNDDNRVVFTHGDIIAPYIAEVISNTKLEHKYPGKTTVPYGMTSDGKEFDAACARPAASWANSCETINKNCDINAHLMSLGPLFFPGLVATKDITSGEEIFTSYGKYYFEASSIHRPFVTQPAATFRRLNYTCKKNTRRKRSTQSI